MSLRVTQGMMSSQLLRNLNANLRKMDNYQNQLSTGRKINKPSDDPVGITYGLRYRSELAANAQHQRNLDTALSFLDFTDTVLGQAGEVLHNVRELTVKASTGSNPQDALDAIKQEIDALYDQLVDIGNSRMNGKYIFNGQKTDIKPYTPGAAEGDSTDGYNVMLDIGVGDDFPINIIGESVFGDPNDLDNAFLILRELSTALGNGDFTAIGNMLNKIDSRMDTLLGARAEIGARVNRAELVESRLKDARINIETLQSRTEDADAAELFTNLTISENVYQASLAVGAKLIRPSLIDFLR